MTNIRYTFVEFADYWLEELYLPHVQTVTKCFAVYAVKNLIIPNTKTDILLAYVSAEYINDIIKVCVPVCISVPRKAKKLDLLMHEEIRKFGTRISETIALKYADVDFSNKSILIMRQLGSYIDHKTNEKVKGEILPKTDNGVREILVPDWVLEEIIVARGCYEKNKLRIPSFEDHDYICCKINGKPYHRRSLSHDFNQLMSMCGIHNIPWHDLRHIYASTLKNNVKK